MVRQAYILGTVPKIFKIDFENFPQMGEIALRYSTTWEGLSSLYEAHRREKGHIRCQIPESAENQLLGVFPQSTPNRWAKLRSRTPPRKNNFHRSTGLTGAKKGMSEIGFPQESQPLRKKPIAPCGGASGR